jgi:hypothetical protein
VLPKDKRNASQLSTRFIGLIGELFAVEARAKDMTEADRYGLRQQESQPVIARIEALLVENLHAVLPQGKLGQALHYLHGQWPKLIRYVENGTWPISNNVCENSIRPFVVGRRYRHIVVIEGSSSRVIGGVDTASQGPAVTGPWRYPGRITRSHSRSGASITTGFPGSEGRRPSDDIASAFAKVPGELVMHDPSFADPPLHSDVSSRDFRDQAIAR